MNYTMALAIFLAVVVPISFLYVVHWLDLYGGDRPRIVLACFAWGLIAFVWSFVINRYCMYIVGLGRPFVATRTAPFVEEFLKAGILVYLLCRGQLTYFVDGAIYGFASGIGFAVIENLRYIQLYPDNYFATIVLRDFSSALGHGTMTAMTGVALGGFVISARRNRGIPALLVGWTAAITLHYAWNNFAYFSTFNRFTTEWVFVGVALTGLALVAATILWGLHRERLQLKHALNMKLRVTEEEANVIQHMDDLDHLLVPIEQHFGEGKRKAVANFLHLEAQLGLKEDLAEQVTDPQLRVELDMEIKQYERELDIERRNVGLYVMLYVRSIFPDTRWSLWARLGQTLSKRRPSLTNIWLVLAEPRPSVSASGESLYTRMQHALDLRAQSAAPTMKHVHELPQAMQRYVHWVIQEVQVTVRHAAASLGHHEAHAHEMLNHLVAHGFLHRSENDGQVAFHARVAAQEAERPHIWDSLTKAVRPS